MLLRLIAVGNKMPEWVTAGFSDYAKRFPPGYKFSLLEITPEKRTAQSDLKRIRETEGKKILSALHPGNLVIALDSRGQPWSTEKLAENLHIWHSENRSVDFLVGGPEGLAEDCLQVAQIKWSLSNLTLPHPLVRIVVTEQLYRAWSILQNHPYHR
jgi:23S rRNA (pseudouridine1915-N3)-methyltransferase